MSLFFFVILFIKYKLDSKQRTKVNNLLFENNLITPRRTQFTPNEIIIEENFGGQTIIPYSDIINYSISECKTLLRIYSGRSIDNFNISSLSTEQIKILKVRLDKFASQFVKNSKFKSFWGCMPIIGIK